MFSIRPMRRLDAEVIASWHYPVPYSMYDLNIDDIPALLGARNRYFAVVDASGELMGFCCFGQEGRVEGGEYESNEFGTLDVGVGMSPERIGKGLGDDFIRAILKYGLDSFEPTTFRVSIADFNLRSQRAFLSQGFAEVARFNRPSDGMLFIQFERRAAG
jgi:ribosomal-protein-alanine N-acetyltransferase